MVVVVGEVIMCGANSDVGNVLGRYNTQAGQS